MKAYWEILVLIATMLWGFSLDFLLPIFVSLLPAVPISFIVSGTLHTPLQVGAGMVGAILLGTISLTIWSSIGPRFYYRHAFDIFPRLLRKRKYWGFIEVAILQAMQAFGVKKYFGFRTYLFPADCDPLLAGQKYRIYYDLEDRIRYYDDAEKAFTKIPVFSGYNSIPNSGNKPLVKVGMDLPPGAIGTFSGSWISCFLKYQTMDVETASIHGGYEIVKARFHGATLIGSGKVKSGSIAFTRIRGKIEIIQSDVMSSTVEAVSSMTVLHKTYVRKSDIIGGTLVDSSIQDCVLENCNITNCTLKNIRAKGLTVKNMNADGIGDLRIKMFLVPEDGEE